MKTPNLFIGAMSGTSADSIDTVLVDFSSTKPKIVAHYAMPLEDGLQQQIIDISTKQNDSLTDALILDRRLGLAFAKAVSLLLDQASLSAEQVRAIGSHGQTLRHQTRAGQPKDPTYTLQIGDPNTIAELTGIDVVADFRRRDLAAGGEAAPLVPGFHQQFFSHPKILRAIVNIGGFANVSLLEPGKSVLGFDTGPGNCLLDGWINRQLGLSFDRDGRWSAEGKVNFDLLKKLKGHEYFNRPIPKSTGRELFNMAWVGQAAAGLEIDPVDLQSTLMQLTVDTIVDGLKQASRPVEEIYVCGGGAHNSDLMSRLRSASNLSVETTATLGIDPKLVEACAFAWMAKRTLAGDPANVPAVTGAKGARILGGIYQA